MPGRSEQIRRLASEFRRRILVDDAESPIAAQVLLAAADASTGFTRIVLAPDDILLAGAHAALDREARVIWQSRARPISSLAFDAAHEYAHLVLHSGAHACTAVLEAGDAVDEYGAPVAAQTTLEGYSPGERQEYEANQFAAELLLPADVARRCFQEAGWNAAVLASRLGLSQSFVRSQLARAVLDPPASLPAHGDAALPSAGAAPTALDISQQEAARWHGPPLLVGAGPGTGKTRTLIARCVHLVADCHVPAGSILALTFSRRAAEEMRERLADAGVGADGIGPWIGTFHAFGLEILRRYGDRAGLAPDWRLMDSRDAFELLERNIERLELDELANVQTPTLHLRPILAAISRAKDELCAPQQYAQLAQSMHDAAGDEITAFRRSARTVEAARIYAAYQQLLRQANAVDFGDLIMLAVEILQSAPDASSRLRAQFPYILADEYQDVNRACSRLLRLMAGPSGKNLWLVGDRRQSIYRFRGASPANIAQFRQDYPDGVERELAVNYRSRAQIVSLFSAAASRMGPQPQAASWRSARGDSDGDHRIVYAVADDQDAQARGIAEQIAGFRERGYAYRDMAILCRTHRQASRLARQLFALGAPVRRIESLLDRLETRDLYSLLLASTPGRGSAIGLVRVAQFAQFGFDPDNAVRLAAAAATSGLSASEALASGAVMQKFADLPGCRALRRILAALRDIDDPALCLERFVFQESEYLSAGRPAGGTAQDASLANLARGCAIRQAIDLARRFAAKAAAEVRLDPDRDASQSVRSKFLTSVRRLAASGDPPILDLGANVHAFDAVLMITAHAAKGLEFPVVFVPNLSDGQFPSHDREALIPEPAGMAAQMQRDAGSEEECLFFVAVSRAREHLVLSRAERVGNSSPAASPLLSLVDDRLHASRWRAASGNAPEEMRPAEAHCAERSTMSSTALNQYLKCPRRYFYAQAAGLRPCERPGGDRVASAIVGALRWMHAELANLRVPSRDEIMDRFQAMGGQPEEVSGGDPDAGSIAARRLLKIAYRAWGNERLRPIDRPEKLVARLEHVDVRVDADLAAWDEHGRLVLARVVLDEPQDRDHTDPLLALMRRAAADSAPSRIAKIELRYLATGVRRIVAPSPRREPDRVKRYDDAAIKIQRGEFPARPREETMCAHCPYFFICPGDQNAAQ